MSSYVTPDVYPLVNPYKHTIQGLVVNTNAQEMLSIQSPKQVAGTPIEVFSRNVNNPIVVGHWMDAVPFHATIRFESVEETYGKNKEKAVVVDLATDTKYVMFFEDVIDLMKRANVTNGTVTGTFGFIRRGNSSYGIVLQ